MGEELVFVDADTKCGGYDMPREEPDLERFERIAAACFTEAEVEGLGGIRYDIVSLLVTGSEKAFLRHRKNVLNDRGDLESASPGLRAQTGVEQPCYTLLIHALYRLVKYSGSFER